MRSLAGGENSASGALRPPVSACISTTSDVSPDRVGRLARGRIAFGESGRGAEALEEVGVLGEVPVAEELVLHTRSRGRAEPVGELAVVQEAGHPRRQRIEVVGVVDEQPVAPVDDLVLDAADAAGDDRARPSTSPR